MEETQTGQQILDFYHKYSKGYYDAMQNNFADTIKLFKAATYISAPTAVQKMKAENNGIVYMPDLPSLKIEGRLASIKVVKHRKQQKELILANIQFDEQNKIVSYKEKPLPKTSPQAKVTTTNYQKYNGEYTFNKYKSLKIQWTQGSELTYDVTLAVPDCVGKFNGKAFFTDQYTAISNQGGNCKIAFDFSTAGQVKVSETTNCRTPQTKNCKFDGEYNLTK
ncbi:hypothetical protein M23134_00402 [Microscilla marina ATCC 23134]|uniref:Uncharacterized protein n=1 Tax=Microscilla marina ATCC 23134 TaxID=313606 RepID=A1ZIY2_MICM2|nr:hypothetical protein M23134_00402 [Microscilla marina ATCC 23134]